MITYNKIQVTIQLENIRHNFRLFKKNHKHIIPVIKSDAYGHGLIAVANELKDETDTFAVGFVNEAVALRKAGCSQRIYSLLGPHDDADYTALWDHTILCAFSQWEQLETVAALAPTKGQLAVAIKFDTGMRRLGFRTDETAALIRFFQNNPLLKPVMISSHLASADMPGCQSQVAAQIHEFDIPLNAFRSAGFQVEANLANTAGAMAHQVSHTDSIRLGLALYGCNPLNGTQWASLGQELKPAMAVSTPIMQVHSLKQGEGVSYGWTHTATRDSVIAIVGAGYADNYSRHSSNCGFVNIKGHRAPILGRVCMQMTAVDVTDIISEGTEVVHGDRAWLLGGPAPGTITPEEVASWWGTISYEVLCLLGMNPRTYYDENQGDSICQQ